MVTRLSQSCNKVSRRGGDYSVVYIDTVVHYECTLLLL